VQFKRPQVEIEVNQYQTGFFLPLYLCALFAEAESLVKQGLKLSEQAMNIEVDKYYSLQKTWVCLKIAFYLLTLNTT
jgi:hypothetical protein